MDLSNKKCKPCEGGISPFNQAEIEEFKKNIQHDWNVVENKKITKEFLFANYSNTMEFTNRVAVLAEVEGHHPVMHVYYAKLVIELWTHSIKGLSENDFIMASKIDAL